MASSDVEICNLALQKLGQPAIVSLSEDDVAARECNRCYAHLRDALISAHRWGFARGQATLAPSAAAPDFGYAYAFPLPADCLRPLPPGRYGIDWTVAGRDIWTSEGAVLELTYLKRVEDTTMFPATFVEALAARMAMQMCEKLTQSNTKLEAARDDYTGAIREARRVNDFSEESAEPPEDSWLVAMR